MASVISNVDGKEIPLKNCACGGEPEYRSADGLADIVTCPKCDRATDLHRCGLDAVHDWNRE